MLSFVPESLKTAELCLEAVKNNSDALQFVPENLITAELCLEAMKQDGTALQYVPEELRNKVRSMLASSLGDRKHGAD